MIPREMFSSAAEALRRSGHDPGREAKGLIAALDYQRLDETDRSDAEAARLRDHRVALLRAAARLDRVFQLRASTAPGLAFIGAELRPGIAGEIHSAAPKVSVTGKGVTLRDAFESCIGEAAEYLSQLEDEQDALRTMSDGEGLAPLDGQSRRYVQRLLADRSDAGRPVQWLHASRLSDGASVFLPADLCLRRPEARQSLAPPFLLGTGTAAGPSLDAAISHALLELIERDALALWWKGGRRGRSVETDPMQADAFLTRLRQDRQSRKTWLLDVTTEIGAPCVVAISCVPGGGTFAFGAAARMTMDAAVKAALLEACQLELAYEIVEAKIRERGEAALNAFDRAHLLRASAVNAETCALLQPMHDGEPPMRGAPPQSLPDLIAKVAHCGIEVHFLDITRRSWGIPAARLVAPALQLEPSDLVSDRLADVVAKTGGGGKFTGGIPLL